MSWNYNLSVKIPLTLCVLQFVHAAARTGRGIPQNLWISMWLSALGTLYGLCGLRSSRDCLNYRQIIGGFH